MMLRETFVKNVESLKQQEPTANFLFVARYKPRGMKNEIFDELYFKWFKNLAPSKELHRDVYSAKKNILTKSKVTNLEAHKMAFIHVNYRDRFLTEMKRPECIEDMRIIKEFAEEKDVFLVCYEPEGFPCHRFLLIEMIEAVR